MYVGKGSRYSNFSSRLHRGLLKKKKLKTKLKKGATHALKLFVFKCGASSFETDIPYL